MIDVPGIDALPRELQTSSKRPRPNPLHVLRRHARSEKVVSMLALALEMGYGRSMNPPDRGDSGFCRLLAAFGFGLMNDPCFLLADEEVSRTSLVFELPAPRADVGPGRDYLRVRRLLRTGFVIGASRGTLCENESYQLYSIIDRAGGLSEEERCRLRLFFWYTMQSPYRSDAWHRPFPLRDREFRPIDRK